jgi:CRISPR-associated Csx2 family protein
MRRVYLSFLGLGSDKEDGTKGYIPAFYELNGNKSIETEFVQVAEFEILVKQVGNERFDKMIIVATQKSYDANFLKLKGLLENLGAINITSIIISEDMSGEGQWKWFEEILTHIDRGDRITVDITHGYRAIPIVFSTAINFLQKAKNISIDGVFYGAFDKNRHLTPIVDMKEFYLINDWAEAVSRLVEDADARKIAQLSKRTPEFQVGELNDPQIIKAIEELTNAIRNVDVQTVGEKAETAIKQVQDKVLHASLTGKILLDLVREKFIPLSLGKPVSEKYDQDYFKIQLEIIRLLLEHRLYMQAYTAMIEVIGSLGLIQVEKARVGTAEGRRSRRVADVFRNMVHHDQAKWNFDAQSSTHKDELLPFYEKLKNFEILSILKGFIRELSVYRNGFDHAWTTKSSKETNFDEKGKGFLLKLEEVIRMLIENKIL